MENRFIVTGCARSGTGYAAKLLTHAGVSCGHENVFNPPALLRGRKRVDWPRRYRGDASWLAAPYLESLPVGTHVLHQVRNPIAVVRSLVRTAFFEQPSEYLRFAFLHQPRLALSKDPVEQSMLYWLLWNRLAGAAEDIDWVLYERYRLEDLTIERLNKVFALLGADPAQRTENPLSDIPTDVNSRGEKGHDDAISWETLPGRGCLSEFRDYAASLGYPTSD